MKLRSVFLTVSAVGIIVALYHAYDEIVNYSTEPSNACHLSGTLNCASVSLYSHPFGVPLYVFGVIWFPLTLFAGYRLLPNNRNLMLPFLMIGNIFTLYLWYLDLGIVWPAVHALCPVCLSMYFINYVLTGLSLKASQ